WKNDVHVACGTGHWTDEKWKEALMMVNSVTPEASQRRVSNTRGHDVPSTWRPAGFCSFHRRRFRSPDQPRNSLAPNSNNHFYIPEYLLHPSK
ncbi:hypothetical protein J6590_102973, partial [Homalodisca vitripennis]